MEEVAPVSAEDEISEAAVVAPAEAEVVPEPETAPEANTRRSRWLTPGF